MTDGFAYFRITRIGRGPTANAIRASMRRARSIWSTRRHNLAEARRPEHVTAAVDPPLSARQGSGLASWARTRNGGAIALSGATGAFDRPTRSCISSLPEPGRRQSPGSKIQSAASLKGPVIATAAVASPPAPGVISACNTGAFRAVLGPVLATCRKGNGTPTRFNDRDRIPTSRPLRAGGRARGLALDHADGLGRCPVVEISRLAPADRAVRLPESTDSCPSRPALRTGGERERADFGGRRRLRERPGGSSSDHPAAVRLPSRSPLRPRPSPSRASRSRRPVRRPPGRRVICVTAPTKKMCLIQLMRPT
jgi:hypothetical protein